MVSLQLSNEAIEIFEAVTHPWLTNLCVMWNQVQVLQLDCITGK